MMQATDDEKSELERVLLDAEKYETNVDHQVNVFYHKLCVEVSVSSDTHC